MRKGFVVAGALALVLALASCGGDPAMTMKTNEAVRAKVFGAIASDSALVALLADTLMHDDHSRAIMVDKLTTNGEAMQALMAKVARDPVALDAIIGFAVQESTMKEHLLTLFKGMQMSEGRK